MASSRLLFYLLLCEAIIATSPHALAPIIQQCNLSIHLSSHSILRTLHRLLIPGCEHVNLSRRIRSVSESSWSHRVLSWVQKLLRRCLTALFCYPPVRQA